MTALLSLFSLRWTRPSTPRDAFPLPSSIERKDIASPNGQLELLCALPSSSEDHASKTRQPLFFIHGGFGGAHVWVPWMLFFQKRGYACYAISLRGHGSSWLPSFWRMVWRTYIEDLARDVMVGWKEVKNLEAERLGEAQGALNPVLVGHSSGGGLAQYLLSEGKLEAGGLVLCAAVPGHGSLAVYRNWFWADPFFPLRNYVHFFHPRSPLSTSGLVRRIFFSDQLPTSEVKYFESFMPYWESMHWPMAMMRPFVSFTSIISSIQGWGTGNRICVLAGERDTIVSVPICETLTGHLRAAVKDRSQAKKIEADLDEQGDCGVQLKVVRNGPHHFQNDVTTKSAAGQVLEFLEEL